MKTHIISANKLYRKEYDPQKMNIKKAAQITRDHIKELTIKNISKFYKEEFNREIIINSMKALEAFSLLSDTNVEEVCDEITEDSMIIYSDNDSASMISVVHMLAHSLLHTNIIYSQTNFKSTFRDTYKEWFNHPQLDYEVDIFMKYFLTKEEFENLLLKA